MKYNEDIINRKLICQIYELDRTIKISNRILTIEDVTDVDIKYALSDGQICTISHKTFLNGLNNNLIRYCKERNRIRKIEGLI